MGYSHSQRAALREWLAQPEQGIESTTVVFLDALLDLFQSIYREEEPQ